MERAEWKTLSAGNRSLLAYLGVFQGLFLSPGSKRQRAGPPQPLAGGSPGAARMARQLQPDPSPAQFGRKELPSRPPPFSSGLSLAASEAPPPDWIAAKPAGYPHPPHLAASLASIFLFFFKRRDPSRCFLSPLANRLQLPLFTETREREREDACVQRTWKPGGSAL